MGYECVFGAANQTKLNQISFICKVPYHNKVICNIQLSNGYVSQQGGIYATYRTASVTFSVYTMARLSSLQTGLQKNHNLTTGYTKEVVEAVVYILISVQRDPAGQQDLQMCCDNPQNRRLKSSQRTTSTNGDVQNTRWYCM